ncbi:MAG: ester cyclase [Solirubrobacteraceae bacterium]
MFDQNRAALESAVAMFNEPARRERYLDLYAPDVVLHGYPRGVSGASGVRDFYSRLWTAFPDARLELEDMLGSEDRLAVRYTLSGVQTDAFYGAPTAAPEGQELRVEGIAWLRFEKGRVVEVWQASATLDTITRLSARAALAPTRTSASAEAAALRWEERHGGD